MIKMTAPYKKGRVKILIVRQIPQIILWYRVHVHIILEYGKLFGTSQEISDLYIKPGQWHKIPGELDSAPHQLDGPLHFS